MAIPLTFMGWHDMSGSIDVHSRPMRPVLYLLLMLLLGTAVGCSFTVPEDRTPALGPWHVRMHLGALDLPFNFTLEQLPDSTLVLHVENGTEVITVNDVDRFGDSLVVRMPLFDSEFRGRVERRGLVTGQWFNYLKGRDYSIPFTALAGEQPRFPIARMASHELTGQWEVHFSPGTADGYPAIGLFEQDAEGRATGTFLTETGDYRYLEGVVSGDSLYLSCFDGSHAFLFAAQAVGDSLYGRFWSGKHWEEPWVAVRNDQFTLRDPDSLTQLREGYTMADFSFPDLDGRPTSPNDLQFKGKVLMIQIMGSWCPNCVDETRLLNELYARHQSNGLEVLSVAFERYEDPEKAFEGLRRFKEVLQVQYPILYGGRSGKGEASEKLPFLTHVMSYPTLIIVDRSGAVRRIRTGIYGPGTGSHYTTYKRSLESFVETLLHEPARLAVAGG